MAVTAAMIKDLREMTGAGMLDCKTALQETNGDIEKAVEFLRNKGLAAAAKKADRLASEGLVFAYIGDDGKKGVVVEVNSETDFVAKNQEFRTYVEQVAQQAIASQATTMDELLDEKWLVDDSLTVKEALSSKIAVIGENLSIRRFERFETAENDVLVSYIHGGGRVAVLLMLNAAVCNDALVETGKNLCMQIAAMGPKYVQRTEVSEEYIAKEKEILVQQALNEGKAANIVEKMVVGRLNKQLKEICLLDQEYVKDGDLSVAQYLEQVGKEVGSTISVKQFVRFETGEGLQKKEENFAEEVSKAMQN